MKLLYKVICLLFFNCYISVVRCDFYKPTFYEISLDFSKFSNDTRTFDGVTTISLKAPQNVYGRHEIVLDAEKLTIGDVTITDSSNRPVDLVKKGYNGNKYSIWIQIDFNTTGLAVKVEYKGVIGNVGDTGVFMTDEQNIIATNSYPEGVRKIFPCFNDPSIRTSFKLDVKLVNDQWGIHQLTTGLESPIIPAYAVGFIMTLHYRKVDDVSTDKFYVWVPSYNQPLYNSVNNNKVLRDVLAQGTYFYNFFQDSGLDKIHIVMVPGIKPLSLVNHRLISIRPDVIVSSNDETAEMSKATAVATLNAIAKHFFRCVVSPQRWEDFWLSDSLALYLQYALLNNDIFQGMNFPDLFTLELQRPAMRGAPLAVNPIKIDPSILNTDSVFPPAYQGASLLKMLEPLSSRKDIIQDLFTYYKRFIYKSVNTNEFLDFMSNGSMYKELNTYGKSLSSVLDKWIHDTGYPYLTDISITKDGFTLTQAMFYGSNSSSEWIIPFVYTDSSNKNGSLQWVTGNRNDLHKDSNIGKWIQLNKHSKGMFRVNYGSILAELSQDDVYWSLSGVERAALLDDSYQLAWREKPITKFVDVLNLFDKLADEKEYTPFIMAMNHINTLRHLYSQKGLRNQFEIKIGELINRIYETISWNKQKSVNIGEAMRSRSVIQSACEYSVSSCQFDAGQHSTNLTSVLNDLLPAVNCQIVRSSSDTKWHDYFIKFYSKDTSQYARADALYALACPKNLAPNGSIAIESYLDTINSNDILIEDALRAFSYIYSQPEHINQTINYIRGKYANLVARFGDDFMASLIEGISKFLLPNYYSNVLNDIKSLALSNPNTKNAVIKAQADMAERDSIVNANLYQLAQWIHAKAITDKPTTLPPNGPTTAKPNSSYILRPSIITLFVFPFILSVLSRYTCI